MLKIVYYGNRATGTAGYDIIRAPGQGFFEGLDGLAGHLLGRVAVARVEGRQTATMLLLRHHYLYSQGLQYFYRSAGHLGKEPVGQALNKVNHRQPGSSALD